MDPALDAFVRARAQHVCEYCRVPQSAYDVRFPIDHIIAQQHGGRTEPENLALCCYACNRHKGPNIAGIDPETSALTPLFHPRRDRWSDHFGWQGALVIGRTAAGRATIAVLAMNHARAVAVREALIHEKRFLFPPAE